MVPSPWIGEEEIKIEEAAGRAQVSHERHSSYSWRNEFATSSMPGDAYKLHLTRP
jgi:hypothetical protein